MLATARNPRRKACSRRRNNKFLQLLPAIRKQAEYAFRRLPAEAREELIQETIAQAFALFVRLWQKGKLALVCPTPLAKFAIRKVRAGRSPSVLPQAASVLSLRAGDQDCENAHRSAT
jgi:hypothetical protein